MQHKHTSNGAHAFSDFFFGDLYEISTEQTGECLGKAGVYPVDLRDSNGREFFLPFVSWQHLGGHYPDWFRAYDINGAVGGLRCCAQYPISFHYIEGTRLLELDYMLYGVKVAGQRSPARIEDSAEMERPLARDLRSMYDHMYHYDERNRSRFRTSERRPVSDECRKHFEAIDVDSDARLTLDDFGVYESGAADRHRLLMDMSVPLRLPMNDVLADTMPLALYRTLVDRVDDGGNGNIELDEFARHICSATDVELEMISE